jgi:hypothetical protein
MAVAIHLTVNKSYAYRLYCLFYWNTKEKFVNHQALVTLANWKIPPPAEIKWFGEKCGQFYLQQYLLSINDFIKVLLLKAIVKCTTMCVTFCIYVTGHSTHRKESTLTKMHRSQNVWHIHLEKCKKKLLISTLTSDQNVRPNSQTWRVLTLKLSDILGGICRTWEYDRWYTWSVL